MEAHPQEHRHCRTLDCSFPDRTTTQSPAGYAIAEVLRQHGFTRIKGGTLYPLLKRLEDQSLVEHTWHHDQAGPGRKQFSLTEPGRQELERSAAAWHQMSQTLTKIKTTRQEQP